MPHENYTPLHLHSTYSFLDGYGRPDQIMERVKELGQTSCAITDHGNLFAHVPFQQAAQRAGIKALFGCEMYVTDNLRDRTGTPSQQRGANSYPHVTILAQSQRGYENLLALNRIAHEEGFYYKPRVDWDEIARYQDGLIVLSGCLGGYPSGYLRQGEIDAFYEFLNRQKRNIQQFFIELVPEPGIEGSDVCTKYLMHAGIQLEIPVVMTSDAHFPRYEDHEVQDLMLCVGMGQPLRNTDRKIRLPEYQYNCTRQELLARALYCVPDANTAIFDWALDNTNLIASRCDVEIPKATRVLFPGIPENMTSAHYLRSLAWTGLQRLICDKSPEEQTIYQTRLQHELHVMESKDFCDYLLAISDAVQWARNQGGAVVCRGSAGGSLLLYALDASVTDPIFHKLSFERFYDDNRPDPPDVDIDFERGMRDRAIDYIFEKYGRDKCSRIANLSQLKWKSAIQDAAFAYGIPRSEFAALSLGYAGDEGDDSDDNESDQIPETAKEVLRKYPQLAIARKMIGQYRQSSVHAAGVLISDAPLDKIIGIITSKDRVPIAAIDKRGASELGFLKMDFLSVNALDIIAATLEKINQPFSWLCSLTLDDSGALDCAQKGLLAGVFQLDGASAARVLRRIGAHHFEDLVAASALCRPGPGEWVETYEQNKFDPKAFQVYLSNMHPIAADILRDTYGILLYQEQVMRFARELGGFDWPSVHKLRKGISDSAGDALFSTYEMRFLAGCAERGVSEVEATHWWKSILAHGGYSFCRAHAVTYGIISYWTLYLKKRFPAAFYESYLALESDPVVQKRLIREFENIGGRIQLLNPLSSEISFTSSGFNTIVGGFSNITGVGAKTAQSILTKRNERPWENYEDMCQRMTPSLGHKLRTLMSEDSQAIVALAPWYPVRSLPQDVVMARIQQGYTNTHNLLFGINEHKGDVHLVGYVTFVDFDGDRVKVVIEDEFGWVLTRVSAKNTAALGPEFRKLEIADLVVVWGWWQGEALYSKGCKLLRRYEPTPIPASPKKRKSSIKGEVKQEQIPLQYLGHGENDLEDI